jgi:hypothetical protein
MVTNAEAIVRAEGIISVRPIMRGCQKPPELSTPSWFSQGISMKLVKFPSPLLPKSGKVLLKRNDWALIGTDAQAKRPNEHPAEEVASG